ncbi:MAG: DUF5803 family protein [Halarchaeum sp.]
MRRRWLLVAFAFVALAASAGCLGGGTVSDQQLAQNATYDWHANESVSVNATGSEYHAVLNVTGANRSELRFSQSNAFTGETPIQLSAIKFRYPNGTVVNASAIPVSESRDALTVTLPAQRGQFAYTAPTGSRSVTVPVVVSDVSYSVTLSAGMRVSVPLVSSVQPSGATATLAEGRVHLAWQSVSADEVYVKYYLERDVYIFGGLLALAALVALGGVVYFRRLIRGLERDRVESGLDVEDDRGR